MNLLAALVLLLNTLPDDVIWSIPVPIEKQIRLEVGIEKEGEQLKVGSLGIKVYF